MSEVVWAWHFVKDDGTRAQDGVKEIIGKTYSAKGPLVMCENGMHASKRILDALQYAHGSLVRRVECWGEVQIQPDKLCSRHRKPLWQVDATRILHEFACRVAEDALKLAGVTDERCWQAMAAKRRWLAGQATDMDLAAACDAAWAAAWDAARYAAWAAAGAAACDAARSAACDAARERYNGWLTEMVAAEHKERCDE